MIGKLSLTTALIILMYYVKLIWKFDSNCEKQIILLIIVNEEK